MATPHTLPRATPPASKRVPLRLSLHDAVRAGRIDGVWWPQSGDLQQEAADLIDNFPVTRGRIVRLLFSRPDWDDSVIDGRGVRRVLAARGPVKAGSFPSDDTHLMILTMSTGQRLRLEVLPPDTDLAHAMIRLDSNEGRPATADDRARKDDSASDWARWDDEAPYT